MKTAMLGEQELCLKILIPAHIPPEGEIQKHPDVWTPLRGNNHESVISFVPPSAAKCFSRQPAEETNEYATRRERQEDFPVTRL